ncbi:MAG: FMN-binding protein [Anaerorhabdus sp.]
MKKIIYLACFLALISAIAGGALTAVNNLTSPIILEKSIAAEKENLELIFPGGTFGEVEFTDDTGLIKGLYEAKDEGYVFKIETTGYSSTPIQFMLAFDNDGKTVGYRVLAHQETNGFGSKLFDEDYTNEVLSKTSADNYNILTGATVTSNAVIKGIEAAKAIFNEMKGITAKEKDETDDSLEPEAGLKLGNPVSLNEDLSRFDAQIESSENGVYVVNVKGYGLIEGDPEYGDYERNKFEIVITDGKVESVKTLVFGDTKGIGDVIDDPAYQELFIGIASSDLDQEIDTVTSATWTTKSMIAAVQAALIEDSGR